MPLTPLEGSIWEFVDKETKAPCWIWRGGLDENGNPRLRTLLSRSIHPATVLAGLLGMEVQHVSRRPICGLKLCCFPDHYYGPLSARYPKRSLESLCPGELKILRAKVARGATVLGIRRAFQLSESDAAKALWLCQTEVGNGSVAA